MDEAIKIKAPQNRVFDAITVLVEQGLEPR